MSTRKYGDDEVREIFSLATTGDARDGVLPADTGGLTLEQLKQIGREAGIEPARVEQAAASLDVRGQSATVKRALGMPIGVSRVVDLPRAPTDREWEQMIAEFRSTFGVQGVATNTGGIRDWAQGNLHICVEPTERGQQLRLSTLKEDGVALNGLGFVMGGMALLMGAVVTAGGKADKAIVVVGMFGGLSIAAFVANVIRLPRWAREREGQMEVIAERAVKLLGKPDGGAVEG